MSVTNELDRLIAVVEEASLCSMEADDPGTPTVIYHL
jgi:hypothetical protein